MLICTALFGIIQILGNNISNSQLKMLEGISGIGHIILGVNLVIIYIINSSLMSKMEKKMKKIIFLPYFL